MSTPSTSDELGRSNCFGCGRSYEQLRDMPQHQPLPNESESNRCPSIPKKYPHFRCMYAAGHECIHSARVAGTGTHYWAEDLAV